MKEKQRALIIEIMKADEEAGLYTTRKQTAVDWLFAKLWETPKDKLTWHSILNDAKAREKMQIERANLHGASATILHKFNLGQYYKETYGEDE